MSVGIEIKIKETHIGWTSHLLRTLAQIADPEVKEQALDDAAGQIAQQIRDRISDDKKSHTGKSWPAWSEKYRKQNTKKNSNRSLLQRENQLHNSISWETIGDGERRIGTPLLYGIFHDEGSGHLPQREFMGVSERGENEIIDEIMRKYIKAAK